MMLLAALVRALSTTTALATLAMPVGLAVGIGCVERMPVFAMGRIPQGTADDIVQARVGAGVRGTTWRGLQHGGLPQRT